VELTLVSPLALKPPPLVETAAPSFDDDPVEYSMDTEVFVVEDARPTCTQRGGKAPILTRPHGA
jgi:hypothetical protein